MTVLSLAFFGVASTSLLLAIALYAAFLRFGRPRHATLWAVAFALIGLDHTMMAFRLLIGPGRDIMNLVACTASLTGATLVAMGFRERSGLRGKRVLVGALAVMVVLCTTLTLMFPYRPVHHPVVTAYVVVMLSLSIAALRKGPEHELAAGHVTLAMMSLFTAFFVLLTALGMVTVPWGSMSTDFYHAIYVVGVPASLTGIGLFALFLLAEDLAHEMRRLAIVDPLTGLLNRRGFEEVARRVKAQCRRKDLPFCVVVADLDHFKAINDRFGHKAGDLVLSEFARRLRGNLREGDLLARLGGEEFVLLLPDVDAVGVATLLDRLRADLAAVAGPVMADPVVAGLVMPTVSFGAAQVGSQDMLAACLERADMALYEAKRDGRDCVRVAA